MTDRDRPRGEYRYRPAWWLPGGHAQTLWGRFGRRVRRLRLRRESLSTPDGDSLEIHELEAAPTAPRLLLLHGLEGSSDSHYVHGILGEVARRGWGGALMVFRGCGPTPNVARRFYHSGETVDLDFAIRVLRDRWPASRWCLAGVSLGGNVLLKWLGEQGDRIDASVLGAAAISVPFDLEAGARRISSGGSRIYDRAFLRSLRRKARAKLPRYPDLFDETRLRAARTVFEFDDAVTAPVHGFRGARDYYAQSSSLRFLSTIRAPTLLLSSRDDPFLPSEVLARVEAAAAMNPALQLEFHTRGGHVGFVAGRWPWRPFYYAEWRIASHFDALLERAGRADTIRA